MLRIPYVSILSKLMIIFLIIISILYGLNFAVNEMGVRKNREEISKSLISSTESITKVWETEITRISMSLKQSAIEIAVLNAQVSGNPMTDLERVGLLMNIRKHLDHVQRTSRFIRLTSAYLPSLKGTLSVENLTPYIDPSEFLGLQKKEADSPFVYYNNRLYMTVPYTNSTSSSAQAEIGEFVLAAELYPDQIGIILDNMIGYKGSGAYLIHPAQGWVIGGIRSASMSEALKQFVLGQDLSDHNYQKTAMIALGQQKHFVVMEYSPLFDTIAVVHIPEAELYVSLNTYYTLFWAMSIISLLVVVAFLLWSYRIVHKPLKMLLGAFRKVEMGKFDFTLPHNGKESEFGYLFARFNSMLHNLNVLIQEVYEQKIRSQRSELKRLQSQINPHFLYNNFFVLSRLISRGDQENATRFSEYLGQYFQFVTRDADEEISLDQEVQHARTYVDIQSVCYSGLVKVSFAEVPEPLKHLLVPRLIVQPIVENCYKYVFQHVLGRSELQVGFEMGEASLSIVVEDSGSGITDDEIASLQSGLIRASDGSAENTGLINVHRRLRIKYGSDSGIEVSRSRLGGLRVEIRVGMPEGGI
ncbi:sensor histidine kinase [Paenibacillus koleovorans]|uniref:sensor histidine kinase n=1 Tax=Paenibacillus koleovorans TaxID=121608 RepID=UPI0013E371A8|nr:histidine kinase [Paenibacillus koleovorans]